MGALRLGILALTLLALPAATGCAASETEDSVVGDDANVTAATPIKLGNFINHPRIVEIRGIVTKVEQDIQAKRLTSEKKDNLCEGVGESTRETFSAGGKVRRLVLEGGSDDSAGTTTATYDEQGVLRFAFVQLNDVFGRARETRIYFGADGKRIFEVVKSAQGKQTGEFSFGDPDIAAAPFALPSDPTPLETDIENPAKLFASPPACN